jgi:prepilin-type N-terminal cleavage/methylation domain-containing protein
MKIALEKRGGVKIKNLYSVLPVDGFSGFTMIEIAVVIGLLAIIASLSLFISTESYKGNNFRNERDLLVTSLQHARAQSINNVCVGNCGTPADGKPHGVHIVDDGNGHISQYVVFQGITYNPTDPMNSIVDVKGKISQILSHGGLTDIYFSQLSGNANPTGSINLYDGVSTSTITIGREGQILWTN